MSLSADALTTGEALKRYLSISSSDNDELIDSLIDAVSAQFNSYTGRKLAARDYSHDSQDQAYDPDNAILNGSGHGQLLLPQYPVVSLSSLEMDGLALSQAPANSQSGWVLDQGAGLITLLDQVFSKGVANIRLAYRAGFETIPADLAQAALEQAATRFQESAEGHGRLGISARTLADGSLSYSAKALLPQVSQVLDRYVARSAL